MSNEDNRIQPLIWQFKINLEDKPFWQSWPLYEKALSTSEKYEQRFFWSEHTPIILNGLSREALWLSAYEFETHSDCYLLLDDNRNVKFRHKKLHVKPLVSINNHIMAYKPKIKFHLLKEASEIGQFLGRTDFSGFESKSQVKEKLRDSFVSCDVYKEAFTLDLMNSAHITIELSRIMSNGTVFYSLVVESPIAKCVEEAVVALGLTKQSQDYISFLKGL